MIALMLYEYFITIEYEVTIGWRRQVTATSCFFIANRFIMLCMVVTGLLAMILWDSGWIAASYVSIIIAHGFDILTDSQGVT